MRDRWRGQRRPRGLSHVKGAITIAGHVAIAIDMVAGGADGCIAAGNGPVGKLYDQGLARWHLHESTNDAVSPAHSSQPDITQSLFLLRIARLDNVQKV